MPVLFYGDSTVEIICLLALTLCNRWGAVDPMKEYGDAKPAISTRKVFSIILLSPEKETTSARNRTLDLLFGRQTFYY